MMKLATLCYVKKNGRTLMLHRVKKPDDVHEGKWNGLGGKFEPGESPEECVIREIREEAGLRLRKPRLKGVLTFPDFTKQEDWYVFVFTATQFTGRLIDSPEGDLAWIPDRDLLKLNLWEGDKVFLPLLRRRGHFSGKFHYRGGRLAKYSVEKY
ncbi:MAG: DNA mismatch repair protein MutT [Elusimicrobia bacterium GWB2_63_22]|nr:MAG: DNA mismatch repair protein MutT [Elusimicrobia bacterium GWB2_63_22]